MPAQHSEITLDKLLVTHHLIPRTDILPTLIGTNIHNINHPAPPINHMNYNKFSRLFEIMFQSVGREYI